MNRKKNYTLEKVFKEPWLLEQIISLLPGHVYWKDRNGVLIGCNDEQAKFIGLESRHDIVGLTASETLPKELAKQIAIVDTNVINTGSEQTEEEILPLSSGERLTYLSKKVPLRDKHNKIIGILGVSFDITELKRTKMQLADTHHKLEGMTIASASIAHEVRTPLATIKMHSHGIINLLSSLIDGYKLAKNNNLLDQPLQDLQLKKIERSIQTIEHSVTQAGTFIDILLTNLNPLQKQSEFKKCSIADCIKTALAEYPFTEDQKQKILWNKSCDFIFNGNKILMIHVLFNLIKNALYYTAAKNTADTYIDIKIQSENDKNLLIFKDTGIGIAQKDIAHIFNRFYSKTKHGSGIGLAFCKMIIEQFGGNIECSSKVNEHTTFILSFPKIEDTENDN